ncbi:hypothetical protein HanRHA438_Chr08g0342751 [Helianthus annuus]|nr:hypothetical protein HanRHA438_Chr08g0342751 [Helianthus annuus]
MFGFTNTLNITYKHQYQSNTTFLFIHVMCYICTVRPKKPGVTVSPCLGNFVPEILFYRFRFRTRWKEVRIFPLHLVQSFPGVLGSTFRIPANLDQLNPTPPEFLNFPIQNLYWFFDKSQFIVHSNLSRGYIQRLIRHTIFQIGDMKHVMNSTQFLRQLKPIRDLSNPRCDFERTYITRAQLSPFSKQYNTFPRRYLQHKSITDLKLQRFPSVIRITLLSICGTFQPSLNLDNLVRGFLDKLGSSQLLLADFSPTKWRSTLPSIQGFKRSGLDTSVVTIVVRKLSQQQVSIPTSTEINRTRSQHIL